MSKHDLSEAVNFVSFDLFSKELRDIKNSQNTKHSEVPVCVVWVAVGILSHSFGCEGHS
jgi:hypothetical protein